MLSVNECKEYIAKLNKEYQDKHIIYQERDELVYENNVEKRDVKGYHGREILELLQNADDAYQKSIELDEKPECELEVEIIYKNNVLIVSNTGTFFDKDGIKAIVQGNNSPKAGKLIGNKGTGFRSVLNWANRIRIFSGNFNVEFSKEIADDLMNQLKNTEQIKKQLEKHHDLYFPILSTPKYLQDNPYDKNKTVIELTLDEEKINDDYGVESQLKNIDHRMLLFLPNVSKISITLNDEKTTFERERINYSNNHPETNKNFIDKYSVITLKKLVNDEVKNEEYYDLFERTIFSKIVQDDVEKDIELIVAVPNDETSKAKNLYTYFPLLGTKSPFNCVMHATYDLGNNRDTINRNENNKTIILEQLKHLVWIANYYIDDDQIDKALNLLVPTNIRNDIRYWEFETGFNDFNVGRDYFGLLGDVKFLKNLNGKSLSFSDEPTFVPKDTPDFIRGDIFSKYVREDYSTNTKTFIDCFKKYMDYSINLDESKFANDVNTITEEFDINQNVELFIWWNKEFRNSLPNCIKSQDGLWLSINDECYFLDGSFNDITIPSWVKVPAIDGDYQTILFEKTKNIESVKRIIESSDSNSSISRIISQNNIFPLIKFSYRDRSNIVPTINSSVKTFENAVDYLKWLWKNYRNDDNCPPKRNEPVRYYFPNVKKEVSVAEQLYIKSDLAHSLFADISYQEILSFDELGIEPKDEEEFEAFLTRFGVRKYPVIKKSKIDVKEKYIDYLKSEILNTQDVASSNYISIINCEVNTIENLERVLNECDTTSIIQWILSDEELLGNIHNKTYLNTSNYTVTYQGNAQRQLHYWNRKVSLKNYMRYKFNECKWIIVDGERFSPNEVILETSKSQLKFKELVPIITKEYIDDLARKIDCDYEQVYECLSMFDFCNSVLDLDSHNFYNVMLKIPTLENNRRIDLSRSIYRLIESPDFDKTFDKSDNKTEFFKTGKLLTKSLKFELAQNTYVPSIRIVNKNKYNIVDKGNRTNNKKFIDLFGCKEFDDDFKIVSESIELSELNDKFVEYFNEFKRFANAYSTKNQNIEKNLQMLSVSLVKRITLLSNDVETDVIDNYTEIRESTTKWFILCVDDNYDIFRLSECIENIFSNIANTPGFDADKIGELFRTEETAKREFLIKKEFNSLDVISGKTIADELKEDFINAVNSLSNSDITNQVDVDFNQIDSINEIEKIIRILSECGVSSFESLKHHGFIYELNTKDFYNQQIREITSKEKEKYANYLYNLAQDDEQKQREFLNLCDKFENYKLEENPISVIDVNALLIEIFGNWREAENTLDYKESYRNNYLLLNPDKLHEDEISNSYDVKRMIYFNKIDEFKVWLSSFSETVEEEQDLYSKLNDIVPKQQEIDYQETSQPTEHRGSNKKRVFTKTAQRNKERNQKIVGNKGERLIYNYLKKTYGEQNVFPKSEAFVEMGIILPGQEESGKCDIEYFDPVQNKRMFVEVKAGDKNSFDISPGELEFAKENGDNYELFIVYDLDLEEPNFIKIEKKFWNDARYHQKDIIEKIHFTF